MRCLLFSLLLTVASAVHAVPRCAPFESSPQFLGVITHHSISDPEGPYLLWKCYAMVPEVRPAITRHCIAAPWSVIDLRRLGDRVDTIRNAPDPLAAWRSSYQRHVGSAASARCVALLKALR